MREGSRKMRYWKNGQGEIVEVRGRPGEDREIVGECGLCGWLSRYAEDFQDLVLADPGGGRVLNVCTVCARHVLHVSWLEGRLIEVRGPFARLGP